MRNALKEGSTKYNHMVGLLAKGRSVDEVAAQLDVIPAYVAQFAPVAKAVKKPRKPRAKKE